MYLKAMNTRHKAISRISREYTKMTEDEIRTHARNEPRTYKALMARKSLTGVRPKPLGQRSRVFDRANSHIYVNAFKSLTASFLLITACINDCNLYVELVAFFK